MSNLQVETMVMRCVDKHCDFKAYTMQRRPVGDYDILIDMKYCGICHSDLSISADHLKGFKKTNYPCVPGHELSGICTQVGEKVTKIKVGQKVGVGCMVDSCQKCSNCKSGEEQLCTKNVTTYNGKDNGSGRAYSPCGYTLGGYTTKMVVNENFAIIIPDDFPLEYAGPVMCAGITMYDPMKKQGVTSGSVVGIVGLGGLGQFGIKIAKALDCKVVVISRSESKGNFAFQCGVDNFILSSDPQQMKQAENTIDLIINTIPVYHNYVVYNTLLKKQKGRHVILGLHAGLVGAHVVNMITFDRSRVLDSLFGGIKTTQEIMDICAEHKIYPDIKLIQAHEINQVYEKLDANNDDGLRYVLDISSINEETNDKCIHPPPILKPHSGGISYLAGIKEALWLFATCKWY